MEMQHNIEEYLSTGQAAKLLGLTISTVQKMTEEGVLSAYVTPGGHRRILSSSFNQFCYKRKLKEPKSQTEKHLVCIMHSQSSTSPELDTISKFPNVKVIANPLELLGLQQSTVTLFMDARLPWLDETVFQPNTQYESKAQFFLYNSEALPSTSALKSNSNLTTIEGDINRHLIFGYLLQNTHASIGESALRLTKESYTERPKFSRESSNSAKKALSIKGNRINNPAKPAVKVTGKPTA
jgi:excisionase family DNA binding protein